MATGREKVYNIDLVVEDLKSYPHTYATILTKEEVYNATMQFNLRRKINKLCKDGRIFKATIPGTRYGQVLLYIEPRPYKIIVESSRIGVNVYYFLDFTQPSKLYVKVTKFWKLENTEWIEHNEEKTFFDGFILKMI